MRCRLRFCWRKATKSIVLGYGLSFQEELHYCTHHHKTVIEVMRESSLKNIILEEVKPEGKPNE
jgi:hypothetical protein